LTQPGEIVDRVEPLYRTAQRHYMDLWLAAERSGKGHDEPFREGRRRDWLRTVLAPVRESLSDVDWQRLEAALCLVLGGEAFIVMRDICHLDPDEATQVQLWAATALVVEAQRAPQTVARSGRRTRR
jgi:hypothetical protein